MRRILALAAVVLVAACGTTATHHASAPLPRHTQQGNAEAIAPATATAPHCGLERWPVKTGTDPDATKIDLNTVVQQTIAGLTALTAPAVLPQDARAAPTEMTVYQVHATLTEYKQEADSDYHLVLMQTVQTATGPKPYTMIAEIPAPACVGRDSPLLPGITKARAEFDARFAPGDFWQPAGVPVTVTGVGFFDTLHGQTGVSSNGIELHPVLDITFG